MQKVNIVYYEGRLNRALMVEKAKREGRDSFRPWIIEAESEFPIVPRQGDRIQFLLDEHQAKFFGRKVGSETWLSATVQFVELNQGQEDLRVICTDEGHKDQGIFSGNFEEEYNNHRRALGWD